MINPAPGFWPIFGPRLSEGLRTHSLAGPRVLTNDSRRAGEGRVAHQVQRVAVLLGQQAIDLGLVVGLLGLVVAGEGLRGRVQSSCASMTTRINLCVDVLVVVDVEQLGLHGRCPLGSCLLRHTEFVDLLIAFASNSFRFLALLFLQVPEVPGTLWGPNGSLLPQNH
jgi:hypothetical protein